LHDLLFVCFLVNWQKQKLNLRKSVVTNGN
jgi:hypothetical protein